MYNIYRRRFYNMKYYSEILNQLFDSTEELVTAEYNAKTAEELEAQATQTNSVHDDVDSVDREKMKAAEVAFHKACSDYKEVKSCCKEIWANAVEAAKNTLNSAKKHMEELSQEASSKKEAAEKEYFNTLKDYCAKYGAYTSTYTLNGDKDGESVRTVEVSNSVSSDLPSVTELLKKYLHGNAEDFLNWFF